VRSHTAPGEPILALPADAGLYFMTDRPPALYNLMFLPGLLDSKADEQAAIAQLKREGVRLAIVGQREFVGYGYKTFGGDYNRLLGSYLERRGPVASFGERGQKPAAGTNATRDYRIYDLR
jgi:hypothetical protein